MRNEDATSTIESKIRAGIFGKKKKIVKSVMPDRDYGSFKVRDEMNLLRKRTA